MKKAIVLGGGGFIGGHLAKYLKSNGYHVRICDIKNHEFFKHEDICHEFILGDLTDPSVCSLVITEKADEVYQLAADMGGAEYIFSGLNDANVMYNSAIINLNIASECIRKNVKKVFYSSSACMYPEHNQLDPNNPNCEESSAYPANPDSEYGWEKLFSERIFLAFNRNHNLDVRIARFHNIYGPMGTYKGGKEKAPAAMIRKACQATDNTDIEVWGDGQQTRSFLFIDACIEAVIRLMNSDFKGPVNIGSEEMVSINNLAKIAIKFSGKSLGINNLKGDKFFSKYKFPCPVGVRGRNSDNKLFYEKIGWDVKYDLEEGIKKTHEWIKDQDLS
jgi:nucleoside-diphosphate-sugar epimerase